jgi:hypothetical protein
LTLTSVKTKYKSIPRPKGPSFSSKCWVKDKLELVPLFANIYKGFVALPSHLNFPQEIKKKNTKQKKYKENRERKKKSSLRNGATYHTTPIPGRLSREDSRIKFRKTKTK